MYTRRLLHNLLPDSESKKKKQVLQLCNFMYGQRRVLCLLVWTAIYNSRCYCDGVSSTEAVINIFQLISRQSLF